MLLWHGSRLSNFVGILSQGLRIAPPEAPASGYLFGKGVYFADMASKSACYCYPTNNIALILLCDVALGNWRELYSSDHNAANLPKGSHSTKCVGQTAPSEFKDLNGIKVPYGKPAKTNTQVR
jgi:poly [ADP-ribose] polymerase